MDLSLPYLPSYCSTVSYQYRPTTRKKDTRPNAPMFFELFMLLKAVQLQKSARRSWSAPIQGTKYNPDQVSDLLYRHRIVNKQKGQIICCPFIFLKASFMESAVEIDQLLFHTNRIKPTGSLVFSRYIEFSKLFPPDCPTSS